MRNLKVARMGVCISPPMCMHYYVEIIGLQKNSTKVLGPQLHYYSLLVQDKIF